jgi:uncharacterized protein (TIGR03435 family)
MWLTAILFGVASFTGVQGVAAQPPSPIFEAASIRPEDPKNPQGSYWRTTPAGDIYVHSVPMIGLIASAYGVADYQVLGAPGWVTSEYFDLSARSGDDPSVQPDVATAKQRLEGRLQALLAERCQLVVRRSTQKQPAWILTVDHGGSKLRPAMSDPDPTVYHIDSIHSGAITVARLSGILSTFLNGVVVDKTNMPGDYQLDLRWSRSSVPVNASTATPGTDLPELPGALRQQLGLVLTRQEAPIEVLIVERIQKPSAN